MLRNVAAKYNQSNDIIFSFYTLNPTALVAMSGQSGLSDLLKIPDELERLSLESRSVRNCSRRVCTKNRFFEPFFAHFVTWFWVFVYALGDP